MRMPGSEKTNTEGTKKITVIPINSPKESRYLQGMSGNDACASQ